MLGDDIANFQRLNPSPAPNAFNPKHSFILSNRKVCYTLKGDRVSYLSDVEHKALSTPTSYKMNHRLVEARVTAPSYKKRIKEGSDVACFLKVADSATKKISPAQYNVIEAFRKTQTIVVTP